MSKILRQSIVPIAAVAGAQLINLVVSPATRPAQSSSCLQWASEAVNVTSERLQRTFNPPYVPEGMTEGEYNQLREVFHTDDIRLSQPQPTVAQPHAAAATGDRPQASASVDGASAGSPALTADSEYQQERLAIAQERARLFGGH